MNTAVAGTYSVKYTVKDSSNNSVTVTRTVKVFAAGSIITVSPAALVFDSQDISAGASAPLTLTVTNIGNGPLTLTTTGLKLSGTNPGDFVIVSNGIPTAGIAPGGTAAIQVAFDPSAIGVRSAILTINNNAKNSTAYAVNLAGTGTELPKVPNVVGMTQAEAATAITTAGFIVGAVTEQNNDTVPAGQVISQDPAAGSSAIPNSAVALVVSKGSEPTTVTSFAINNGDSSTVSTAVTLNNICTGNPTEYMASESTDFSGASWQPYSSALSFTLSTGDGVKIVYFKVRNVSGESGIVSDAISLSQTLGYVFDCTWGSNGTGNSQFNRPWGVALDASGNIYVTDMNNNRIQKFTVNGTYLTQWGTVGTGNGQFNCPSGIAVDSEGNIFVVDTYNSRIQKFASDGTFLTTWGSYGSGNGQFWGDQNIGFGPVGIAIDSSNNVYVVDGCNRRIQKFTAEGAYLTQWGGYGSNNGQFVYPIGVAVDRSHNIYVTDFGNYRIQKFTEDGTYLTQWGSQGTGDGQFDEPCGVAVDVSGIVYVTDRRNNRIQKFMADGIYLTQWGSDGSNNGQFKYPRFIAVDTSGNVYVADQINNRIQKFKPSVSESTIMLPGNVPLTMVWCPAGTLMMGRRSGEQDSSTNEDPQHQVTLQGFWMGKYELTKAQWTALMGTTPWSGKSYVLNDPNSPAIYVSWNDIQLFITALNSYTGLTFRLPSEAQWEYAARAGTSTRFYWGDDLNYSQINNYTWYWGNCMSEQYAHTVGHKQPNAWGLYDIIGNVYEACQDWYHSDYTNAPTDGSAWESPAGTNRVGRGGGWTATTTYCRSAYRVYGSPTNSSYYDVGFRLACLDPNIQKPVPQVTSFSLNNGDTSTNNSTVTLNNVCTNAPTYFMASESSNFAGATWQTYSTTPTFTLSSGNGLKAVYFKVKNAAGESPVVNDTITLSGQAQAAFEADKVRAVSGDTVTFTDTSDPGAEVIASYGWDFGDGTTGNGATATHVYNLAGTYTVTHTIMTATHTETVAKQNYIAVYASTPLDNYIRTPLPDPAFSYELKNTVDYGDSIVFYFLMNAQTWRTLAEVDKPLWQNWVTIIQPKSITNSRVMLIVSGGSNTGGMPTVDSAFRDIATSTGSVVVVINRIPSEPLIFPSDPLGMTSRNEDDIIAYSFWQYLQTGDDTWPLLLPMVKSTVRAMDLVQNFMPTAPAPVTIKDFVLVGASKRGWTSWLTACTDGRVAAIAPMVIEILNANEQMDHNREVYGKYAEAVSPFTKMNIFWSWHTPAGKNLLSIIDPYSYRDRLTMPKLIFSATGDQYFCPDSSQFYINQLSGDNALSIIPNVDHGLGDYVNVVPPLVAWYVSLLPGKTACPKLTWTASDTEINVTSNVTPTSVVMWTATSANRDFRLESGIASPWTSIPLTPVGVNQYRAQPAPNGNLWTGFYIQMTFANTVAGVSKPYVLSTELRVSPPLNSVAPVANFAGVPPIPVNGHEILFSDLSTIGTGPILSWQWNFGDGTTFDTQSLQDFAHTYATAGTYPVTLTVTSVAGTSSTTLDVVVP